MTTWMRLLLASEKPAKTPNLVGPAAHGLVHAFVEFWPLWLLLIAIALAKLAWRGYQRHRLSKSGIREIDRMDGGTFEVFLSTLFRRLGYHVEVTQLRGDYGADLVLTKSEHRTAVQAKRWNKRVGVKAVQEAVAAKGYYRCGAALVVANREFSQQAKRLARANKVELWDRAVLVQKLLTVRGRETPSQQLVLEPASAEPLAAHPAEIAAAPASTPPALGSPVEASPAATCVTCGAEVSQKVRDYCVAHSTRFGGRIYCFRHQRGVRAMPAS